MRIVILIYSLGGGGAERVTSILARAWADAGHTVTVLTMAAGDSFYEGHAGVTYRSLASATEASGFLQGVTANVQRIAAVRRNILDLRADIAIGMMTTASVLVALACCGTGCRSLGAERVHPPRHPIPVFWRVARKFTYGLLNAVIAQTHMTAQWINNNTFARRLAIIPNPVLWPLQEAGIGKNPSEIVAPNRNVLLSVGRLSPQKNHAFLLRTFALVAAANPSWDLVILGEGQDRASLEHQAIALGLTGRFLLPGGVTNLQAWFRQASLFAMTSNYEGFPNALLEAMAYGLPVLSVDCDTGPRDIIRDHVDGILVPADDEKSFATALSMLMKDTKLRERLACRAIEVRERFSLSRILLLWDSLFADIGASQGIKRFKSQVGHDR